MKLASDALSALRFASIMTTLALGTSALHASTPATPASSGNASEPLFRMDALSFTPVRDFRYQTEGMSSSADDNHANLVDDSDGGSGFQPPPGRRRSYGRSRYEDRMHNSDGSTKIAFMAGGGMNLPVGNTGKFYTPSYDVAAGAGWNFNRMLGVLAEFHYDHTGVTGGAINYEYQNLVSYFNSVGVNADLTGLDGNSHVISVSLNPVISFSNEHTSKLGAYFTGGVGFYHKVTNFTLPDVSTDYYGYSYATTYNLDTASANSFGANGGVGFTYRISEFSNERLFVEARYHWLKIDSSNNNDFFPFNRRNSEYVPILVGLRF